MSRPRFSRASASAGPRDAELHGLGVVAVEAADRVRELLLAVLEVAELLGVEGGRFIRCSSGLLSSLSPNASIVLGTSGLLQVQQVAGVAGVSRAVFDTSLTAHQWPRAFR